ncbi:hypothetical protein P12x_002749 [Tundrisphaera lichenicola]|uniref:hypothetical protein n=1 Tax=Tundrisphaera lichenicola TaxID=2029860 RepID=UPI003EBC740F
MPPTPDEAIAKNKGNAQSQLDRAIRDLAIEVEDALDLYTGEHVYVGLPAYLQYRVEADIAKNEGQPTLRLIDRKLHERFGQYGWKIGILTNSTESCHWVKLLDAREH